MKSNFINIYFSKLFTKVVRPNILNNKPIKLISMKYFVSLLKDYEFCKVVIYNIVFCWLIFRPNLIVMLFNLLHPVFIVGFHCKGCVLKRESGKT